MSRIHSCKNPGTIRSDYSRPFLASRKGEM